MTTASRAQKIQSIIESRKPMAERARKESARLGDVFKELDTFKVCIANSARKVDREYADKLQGLSSQVDAVRDAVTDATRECERLAARFARPTLNIGVAGRAGQGKSTLLQQITGLTNEEIPAAAGDHCTGAPSIVTNHDSPETYADITFYTERNFLDWVVEPFFKRLQLGEAPLSLDEFAAVPLPEAPAAESKDPTTDEEHLKKLRYYQQSLSAYRSLLTGRVKRVPREEIRSYVAQKDANERKLTNWIAVEMVQIKCRFPQSDVGSIALADTPGLGDFLSGAEDRLVKTVGESLDVVIFLRMTPATRAIDPADTNLHGLVKRAIPSLTPAEWSYFVINDNPNTSDNLPFFRRELEGSTMRTRLLLTANCMNQAAVAACVEQILDDVAGNISRLDQKLFAGSLERVKNGEDKLRALVEAASGVLPRAATTDQRLLKKVFGPVWDSICERLKNLVDVYRAKRDQSDDEFLGAVRQAMALMEKGPGHLLSDKFGPGGGAVYFAQKVHALRVAISRGLDELDSSLDASFVKLRSEVLEIFRSSGGGRLKFLEGKPEAEAWMTLLERWKQCGDGGAPVVNAIELLLSAKLSFRGFIQPRVRSCLDILDSASEGGISFAPGSGVEVVNADLTLGWHNARNGMREPLEDLSAEPAMARFALVQDFEDLVVHEGGSDKAKDRWELFYDDHRGEVWPEEFGRLEDQAQLLRDWNAAVASLRKLTKAN